MKTIEQGYAPAIAAIETYYAGIKFRSRAEARWAVFFDTLGIPYQYEPEKYALDSGRYIPDFFLPKMELDPGTDSYRGVFFEVKGAAPDSDAIAKAIDLHETTNCEVYIFWGSNFRDGVQCWNIPSWPNGKRTTPAWIEECPFCGEIAFCYSPGAEDASYTLSDVHRTCLKQYEFAKRFNILDYFLDCFSSFEGMPKLLRQPSSPRLDLAYEAARSARFESPEHLGELKGISLACARLKDMGVFCHPEVSLGLETIGRLFSENPSCPRYDEPWQVPHIAHLRSKAKDPCACYRCKSKARRASGG